MKYKSSEWTIEKLISLYEEKKLNLNPPYQRNDIWSAFTKKKLIDSIKTGYPLPTFFLHKKKDGKYDMVDGQQRTRAILGYTKEFFPDLKKEYFKNTDKDYFLTKYKLIVAVLEDISDGDESMRDFYNRVNKFGTKLNRPELLKSQFYGTPVQKLVEKIAGSERFETLNLFTEATKSRMNDIDFIGELITLLKYGISEKKIQVDRFYEDKDFQGDDAKEIEDQFQRCLEHFIRFNSIYPLKVTRYKQRNDFYTFFGFIKENLNLDNDTFDYFYKLMVLIGKDISPTNEDCFAFQEYATNCVSQSNSKRARTERLQFFHNLLLNKDDKPLFKEGKEDANNIINDVIGFYKLEKTSLCKINDFYLVDINKLNSQLKEPYDLKL